MSWESHSPGEIRLIRDEGTHSQPGVRGELSAPEQAFLQVEARDPGLLDPVT